MKILLFLILFFSQDSYSFDHEHEVFSDILKKHIVFNGKQSLVNYVQLRKKPLKLNSYLKQLSEIKKEEFQSWNKKQQLAFLINTYNAFTLKLIIKNKPVTSIKDLGSFFTSAWKVDFIPLFGKIVDLDHIEHDLIRKKYREPRIHFALVCASISCPPLLNRAYTANNLDGNFTEAMKLFLKDKTKNYYDEKNNTLYLSKIFDWYGDDFKEKYGTFLNLIAPYLGDKAKIKDSTIKFLDYNWGLNSV